MSEKPFFSVVIPTYNRLEPLREAVKSVLDQTFEDLELIVVDDSPEASARGVASSFADARLSYIKNDHERGGAGTRNAGIERARGQWVAFLDDDDTWMPEKLERQAEQIAGLDESVALIYTGRLRYHPDSGQVHTIVPEKEGWIHKDLLAWNVIGGFYSVAIRRDVLEALGGLDERFPAMQDVELYVRVAKDYKVAFLAEPLVRVRDGDSGRITTNYASKLLGSQLFLQKFKDDIRQSATLRHRAAARIFMFAFAEGKVLELLKSAPMTLAGLIIDRRSFVYVLRFVTKFSLATVTNSGRG